MTDVSPLLAQADSLLEANRISEAKQLYAEIARLAPDNADAWLMLGLIEQEQANPAKAEAHLRRAIELDNHLAEAHLNLANLLRLQRRLDDARYHARLAVQIDDSYVEAWIFLGGLGLESEDFSSAEASFKRALRYWPDNPNLHLSLGHSQAGNRQLKDAEESFNRAVALGATSADDHFSLAKINLQLGHFTEAVQNAATALEKAPDRTDIRHLLANALIADRRAAEALPILEDLVKTQPVSLSRTQGF